MTYSWSINGYFKADAEKCYLEMGEKDVTPEKVLNIARDEKTELHKCFEWDDAVASEKYRLIQARDVIRMIVVIQDEIKKEGQPKRVFQISSEPRTYQPVIFFKRNEDEYNILLERAKRELDGIKKRYSNIVEIEPVISAIDEFLQN